MDYNDELTMNLSKIFLTIISLIIYLSVSAKFDMSLIYLGTILS